MRIEAIYEQPAHWTIAFSRRLLREFKAAAVWLMNKRLLAQLSVAVNLLAR